MKSENLPELMFKLIPLIDHTFVRPVDIEFRTTVTLTQVNILSSLWDKDMTMKEISEYMTTSKQQMTLLIEKLVKKGFVIRKTSPDDRRIIIIEITQAGLDLLDSIHAFSLSILDQRTKSMSMEDRKMLESAATQLLFILEKYGY
jgi:MarR family 2-MHQ and catechol resistance regulon transcriptional repressor